MAESTDAIREFASPEGEADSQVHSSVPGARVAVAHQPYIADKQSIPEFTFQAVLAGTLLGIVFGASSLYLVLRVGLTVSASIPVAVLSITLFRAFTKIFGLRPATILENNITQTAGSAGESIAFGVGVTMPALMLLGFEMDIARVMVVSVLGGLLGILMMIPLRRAFIVNMHGKPGDPDTLLYPEGTACAEVLISGEKGGTSGKTVFVGFGIAFLLKFLIEGMTLLRLTVSVPLKFFNRVAVVATDMAPELLGVGYVIGVRVASIMMAGAVIGNLVIVPAIATFGDQVATAIAPGTKPIGLMSLGEIQKNYLRFIGAGCVTAAGIISMMRTLPLIYRSFRASLGNLRGSSGASRILRTDRDLSAKAVLFGSAGLLALLAVFLVRELSAAGVADSLIKGVLGAGLVLIFGFLFVTVSSRLTGEIGSSSNPISGMTVATLAL
ncbi:MAG TPA: oligopeptide transporter, OPT family, partial [Planctomycetaceae bacterium]|nr:oligopeptide transporter, OPT family [Planctomycetaceae bacterium]